ncbi:ATG8-interacting protein 2-like [Triticum urartu]|uniref:ATG8-interacting protein 2-like n=1 Tax=Triticum urartu TaxID=4572 RepID=UPI0020440562|nr:ATG8-interacting protein 2-like [Triticum urartu]XP_048569017.1 ATG8-interacting protein 2-like [Triticum urartu]
MADSGGGSDWEVVSLTASTYAAAPGPISPIHNAADKRESPLLLVPNPPAPPAHFFMSQHFNLPAKEPLFGTHLENNKGGQELESGPAVPDGLNMPICPENYRDSEREDGLVLASPAGNGLGLQVEGGGGGEELQRTTTPCSLPDVAAGSDAAAVGSATLPAPAPAPAATVPVAAPSGGLKSCNAGQAQAWWEKTYSFPRQDGNGNENGTQPLLAFRFVFVAGKLQLQEDHPHLSPVPEFVGQTQKIGCAATEPLGQAKVSMLGGGGPVSQQG